MAEQMGLNKEVQNIQNPMLGAYLIWCFSIGYKRNTPFILLFLILPLLYRPDITDKILRTQLPSGMLKFASKLKEEQLLSIHYFALKMKLLTLNSIEIAQKASLITLSADGYIAYRECQQPKIKYKDIQDLEKAAKKLGTWCSKISLYEISTILKIRF